MFYFYPITLLFLFLICDHVIIAEEFKQETAKTKDKESFIFFDEEDTQFLKSAEKCLREFKKQIFFQSKNEKETIDSLCFSEEKQRPPMLKFQDNIFYYDDIQRKVLQIISKINVPIVVFADIDTYDPSETIELDKLNETRGSFRNIIRLLRHIVEINLIENELNTLFISARSWGKIILRVEVCDIASYFFCFACYNDFVSKMEVVPNCFYDDEKTELINIFQRLKKQSNINFRKMIEYQRKDIIMNMGKLFIADEMFTFNEYKKLFDFYNEITDKPDYFDMNISYQYETETFNQFLKNYQGKNMEQLKELPLIQKEKDMAKINRYIFWSFNQKLEFLIKNWCACSEDLK